MKKKLRAIAGGLFLVFLTVEQAHATIWDDIVNGLASLLKAGFGWVATVLNFIISGFLYTVLSGIFTIITALVDAGDCQIIVGFFDKWKLDSESPSCPTATYQNGSGGGDGTFDQNMNPWSDAYPGANNLTQGFNFSDLISGFMDGLRTSSMFNLPGLLIQDLPESDECEMVIDLGETFGGEHTVTFCNWADSLGVIKGVLLLGFSFLAVRIVILKRD